MQASAWAATGGYLSSTCGAAGGRLTLTPPNFRLPQQGSASIFMGDTGSLGLGGAIAGLAIMTNTGVLLILLGGIFVIEALSVLIQVFSFQTFRKRVFLMAPIHHHFELQGWSETKIILRFWIVAAAFCAIGFTLYQLSIRG